MSFAQPPGRRFYPDDPLFKEPPPRPVKTVAKSHVDLLYDFLDNSFETPHRAAKAVHHESTPAANVNTLGDVPDSAWYSNRHYYRRMSIEDLKRGPGNRTPPAAGGSWRIISAKSDGITPGFVIEDNARHRYLLKLDPPRQPELASAADVIGSKIFYALGYNTPENYIVHFQREKLVVAGTVMWRDASGKKRPLTDQAVDAMLKPQPKDPGGAFRALASRWVQGEPVGPFLYDGTRTDDPNDIVPHEDRRELRGLRVFAAWLNHTDAKSINTLDTLVDEDGLRYVKHYLIDFGSILGSGGIDPKLPWYGHQSFIQIEDKEAVKQALTFGLYVPKWARTRYPNIHGVGLFDSSSFDPVAWTPDYPNLAFLMMDDEDAFWAAKQVAAFTDEEIRAFVETGEYTDPRAVEWITECLIARRDKIAQTWFTRILPLDKFQVVDGELTWQALGEKYGIGKPADYSIRWTGGNSGDEYLLAIIAPAASGPLADRRVNVYLRRTGPGMKVIGVDRNCQPQTRTE